MTFSSTLGSDCTWLSLTPAGGTTQASLAARANPTGLSPGNYSCTITISASNASPVLVQATLSIAGATLTATPGNLSFTYALNSTTVPAPQSFTIASLNPSSGVSFLIVPNPGCGWLNVNPTSGSTPATITISVNTSVQAGNCTLVINSPNASTTPQINVAGMVAPQNLTATPNSLSFNIPAGSATPVGKTVSVAVPGNSVSVSATANSTGNWLSVTPASGTAPLSVNITANPTGLAPNTYPGTVTIGAGSAQQTVNVSLVISALPAMTVAPTPLAFRLQAGSAAPPSQTISVFVSDGSLVNFSCSATSQGNWLNATKATGQNCSVTVAGSSLGAGTYQGTVTVTSVVSTPTNPTQQQVPVSLIVDPPPSPVTTPPVLAASTQGLTFSFVQGGNANSSLLAISNQGGGNLIGTATASSLGNWLSVTPSSFTVGAGNQQVLTVNADPANPTPLPPTTYQGKITLTNSINGQQTLLPVIITVAPSQQNIQLSQNALTFTALENGPDPVLQTVAVNNTGFGAMNFSLGTSTTTGQPWLTASTSANSLTAGSPQGVLIGAKAAGLVAGDYFGTVLVSSAGATNSPQIITVRLTVLPAKTVITPDVQPLGVILTSAGTEQIQITNQSGAPIAYTSVTTTEEGNAWFTASPSTGTINDTTTIKIQPQFGNLASGVHLGSLRILFANGTLATISVVGLVAPPSGPITTAEAPATLSNAQPLASICQPVGAVFQTPGANTTVQAGKAVSITLAITDACKNAVVLPSTEQVAVTFSNSQKYIYLAPSSTPGVLSANWTFDEPTGPISVTLTSKPNLVFASNQPTATVTVTVAPGSNKTVPNLQTIVNAASYLNDGIVTPGGWITLFGGNLGDGPISASSVPLSTLLGNAQVLIGNSLVPLNYVSDIQVNAQVPYDLAPNQQTQISIIHATEQAVARTVTIADTLPAIFSADSSGTGQGAIFHANGVLVDPKNPAHAGETVVIYGTGLGAVTPSVDLGVAAPTPAPTTIAQPTVTIGGVQAPLSFAGLSPGSVALYQVNVVVPGEAPLGDAVPVVITVARKTSQSCITMAVR